MCFCYSLGSARVTSRMTRTWRYLCRTVSFKFIIILCWPLVSVKQVIDKLTAIKHVDLFILLVNIGNIRENARARN